MPACAIAAPPPMMKIIFFGVETAQENRRRQRDDRDEAVDRAHPLCSATSSPSRGRPRHCRSATSNSSTPRTGLSTFTQGGRLALPARVRRPGDCEQSRALIAPATAIPAIQPTINAGRSRRSTRRSERPCFGRPSAMQACARPPRTSPAIKAGTAPRVSPRPLER
jgi:hypothetical protein